MVDSSSSISKKRGPPDAERWLLDDHSSASASVKVVTPEGKRSIKKRFVWPQNLHADFVLAVFDTGLKTVSPKTLIDLMPKTSNGENKVSSEQVGA